MLGGTLPYAAGWADQVREALAEGGVVLANVFHGTARRAAVGVAMPTLCVRVLKGYSKGALI